MNNIVSLALVNKLKKSFGADNVMSLEEVPKLDVISTGVPSLDFALEVGGYPRRLITEIYGKNQLGKSVLSMKAIASAQKAGLVPALITTEGIPDTEWASVHGVDLSNALVLFAHTAEEMNEQAKMISASNEIQLMVIDSLSAAGTASEILADGKKQAFGISGIVANLMHALLPNCWKTNKACVIMNQVRDKMAGTFVTLESPGGHSLHHGASVRIFLKPGAQPNVKTAKVNGQDKEIAKSVVGVVKKNKAGSPDREATWWIYHSKPDDLTNFPGRGIDLVTNVIDVGLATGVVEQGGGGVYSVPAIEYEQSWDDRGRTKFEAWLREDYSRADKLYDIIRKYLEDAQ